MNEVDANENETPPLQDPNESQLRQDVIQFLVSKGHCEDYASYLCEQWKIETRVPA